MTRIKRFVKYTLLIIIAFIVAFAIQNYPVSSAAKDLSALSDTSNLKQHFNLVLNTARPRNYKNVEVLDTVAERIYREFKKYTANAQKQEYAIGKNIYKNVIASFGPADGEIIVIGAHYDVCGEQDGADDNASGVVGIGAGKTFKKSTS